MLDGRARGVMGEQGRAPSDWRKLGRDGRGRRGTDSTVGWRGSDRRRVVVVVCSVVDDDCPNISHGSVAALLWGEGEVVSGYVIIFYIVARMHVEVK